ncbi:metallophosphoesterase family protein [Terrihabitans soli]|uniref:metallophosphoesterase family protein n=1 Tax=Terrihabitans soli TaxID=708113 RepID=UPI001CEDEE9E|nr:metallophosphoesterase family protein [Terrihabitans soli]
MTTARLPEGGPDATSQGPGVTVYPPAPVGTTIYVVGDVHGRADLLEIIHRRIDRDTQDSKGRVLEVYLGDYIDRGGDSAKTIAKLVKRREQHELVCLRGNHEDMLLGFLQDPGCLDAWLRLGAGSTLASYGVNVGTLASRSRRQVHTELLANLPQEHADFLETLPSHYEIGGYFFAHAGVRPSVDLQKQSENDLTTIRADFLEHTGDFGRIVVHGHTPVVAPEFRPNRINIDTGAFATGTLTCLKIGGRGPQVLL